MYTHNRRYKEITALSVPVKGYSSNDTSQATRQFFISFFILFPLFGEM